MVNMRGKLVGIAAYRFRAEGAQGVNFAIAMDTLNAFLGMPQSAVAPSPPKPKPTATPTPVPLKYGAIAYDANSGWAGEAHNYSGLASAESAALSVCGRPGCVIVPWVVGPRYIALATGYGGWGTSGVQSIEAEAEHQALASCRRFAFNCRILFSIHNTP
jgi:hypothetical protein